MKQLLVVPAILALAVNAFAQAPQEGAVRTPLSLRPGAPAPAAPAVGYPRPASEPVSGDPQAQLRDLRARLELLDRRVAELERKQAPDPAGANINLDPTRLRPQQPR